MSFACKSERRCDHSLKDCSAVRGEYCLVCHHNSSLASPARGSAADAGSSAKQTGPGK